MPQFSEKEIGILDYLSKRPSLSQRELAKKTGISLGLINVILKRLAKNGYLQVSPLGKRRVEYLLTQQGLMETTKKTFRETAMTIQNYKTIQESVVHLLRELYDAGYEYFSIRGDGELREVIEGAFFRHLEDSPVTLGKEHRNHQRAVVLNLSLEPMDPGFKGDVVDVLGRIRCENK